MCAKLILRRPKYSSSKESLYKLHWIPIWQRINYKILTLTHKCIQGQAPKYLQDLITKPTTHQTQNICLKILQIPCTILMEPIAKSAKRHRGTTKFKNYSKLTSSRQPLQGLTFGKASFKALEKITPVCCSSQCYIKLTHYYYYYKQIWWTSEITDHSTSITHIHMDVT